VYSTGNAGEVGDGPDQGYSGGADSVPPAPKFKLKTKRPALRTVLAGQAFVLTCEPRIA
jgi:hypothetical protein